MFCQVQVVSYALHSQYVEHFLLWLAINSALIYFKHAGNQRLS
jgi:hypothetical protein